MTSSAIKPSVKSKIQTSDVIEIVSCIITTVAAIYLMILSRSPELHYNSSGQAYVSFNYNFLGLAVGAIGAVSALAMLAWSSIKIAVRLAREDEN